MQNIIKHSTLPKLQQHSMERKANRPSKTMFIHKVLMARGGAVSDLYYLELKDDP